MQKFIKAGLGNPNNGITISMPEESNPESFRFHMSKFQGESEKGMCGYIEMLGIRDAITETISYMYENHKDFVIKSFTEYNLGMIEGIKTPRNLFSNDDPEDCDAFMTIEAKNTSIKGEFDSVKVSHGGRVQFKDGKVIYPERAIDNLNIKISKWQGDSEYGTQGFIRLNALKNAIERTCSTLNLTFKDMHKNAEIEAGIDVSKGKDSSLSL
ncbi:hypothetical protein EN12_22455 [Vibrio cholerae]|nr:hypothetical protein EN12_22455 [Vibrio cholerae]